MGKTDGTFRKLKICVIHGYLLTGTGSNVFVNNLVRNLCSHGHDVYLFCQERHPHSIDFISQYCVFDVGNRTYHQVFSKESPYDGRCFLFNPDLGGLLPVYVYDEYDGFTVRTFLDLEVSEIEKHIQQNVRAIQTVYEEHTFDLIQANHLIISPYVARELSMRHGVPYYITLHGSALNFCVAKDPRLRTYASKSLLDSTGIFAVSNHNRLETMTFFKDSAPDIEKKLSIIPAGVDTELFGILETLKTESIERLKSMLKIRLKLLPNGKSAEQKKTFLSDLDQTSSISEVNRLISRTNKKYDPAHPDQDVVNVFDRIDWERDWIILFVGKYLWTKGIQMVISALPIVLNRIPNLHLILVGFGSYREELEALVYSLESGRRELFRHLVEKSISQMGPGENPSAVEPFRFLEILAERKETKDYFESAISHKISRHVHFVGALNHKELSYLLPCADGLVAASIFPEAFGMVSIEALSCGVLPVVSNQTGFKEIVELVSSTVDDIDEMPRVDLNEQMIFSIAESILKHIVTSDLRGEALKQKCRQVTLDHFSWKRIAERYVEYYLQGLSLTGRLSETSP